MVVARKSGGLKAAFCLLRRPGFEGTSDQCTSTHIKIPLRSKICTFLTRKITCKARSAINISYQSMPAKIGRSRVWPVSSSASGRWPPAGLAELLVLVDQLVSRPMCCCSTAVLGASRPCQVLFGMPTSDQIVWEIQIRSH